MSIRGTIWEVKMQPLRIGNMELKKVRIQKSKGSYFIYLPKTWVKGMELEKGNILVWDLNENKHEQLVIRKSERE